MWETLAKSILHFVFCSSFCCVFSSRFRSLHFSTSQFVRSCVYAFPHHVPFRKPRSNGLLLMLLLLCLLELSFRAGFILFEFWVFWEIFDYFCTFWFLNNNFLACSFWTHKIQRNAQSHPGFDESPTELQSWLAPSSACDCWTSLKSIVTMPATAKVALVNFSRRLNRKFVENLCFARKSSTPALPRRLGTHILTSIH